MTTLRISTLLSDCLSAFSTPEAATAGVTFPPDLCALWAEALRLASLDIRALEDAYARVVHERDQLLSVAEDADLIAHARAGAPRRSAGIIDLSAVLGRERRDNLAFNDNAGGAA